MDSPGIHDESPVDTLFIVLWDTLADILGTAATATLLRRAVRQATPRHPVLAELRIGEKGLLYGYDLPPRWQQEHNGESLVAMRALARALLPLLIEMTGPVVVRRLAGVAALDRLDFSVSEVERERLGPDGHAPS